jgi:hypothetical protein
LPEIASLISRVAGREISPREAVEMLTAMLGPSADPRGRDPVSD